LAAQASRVPRVRVAALMVLDDRIVVVRHRFGTARYHLLPGGGVEFGETLEQAALREVREETGLECVLGRPLIVNDTISPTGDRHIINITFSAQIVGGAVTDAPDDHRVEAVELVTPDVFAGLDMRPPIATELLAALAQGDAWKCTYAGSVYKE